jgi:hypothetical protein
MIGGPWLFTKKPTGVAQPLQDAAEIEGLLVRIQEEENPDRLLLLAQELQQALNMRKARLAQLQQAL